MEWKGLQYSLYHIRDPKLENKWIMEYDELSETWYIKFRDTVIWANDDPDGVIPEIIATYIKTSLKHLDEINDHKTGLVKQLKAMDRRVGRKKWWEILRKDPPDGIRAVVQYRIDVRDKDKKQRQKERQAERYKKWQEEHK